MPCVYALQAHFVCKILVRLFTVPYFSVKSWMPIVEFDGPPSWSLDASETGESTKCLRVGVRGGENRETVTASHCLAFTGLLVAPATATADWSKGQ